MAWKIHKLWRLILATLLTPILGGVLTIMGVYIYILTKGDNGDDLFEAIRIGGVFGAIIGWPTMLLVGLPIHALICKREARHWAVYALAGALAGTLASIGFLHILLGGTFSGEGNYGVILFFGIPTGIFSSVLFHFIRGPHTPLTPPSNTPTSPA